VIISLSRASRTIWPTRPLQLRTTPTKRETLCSSGRNFASAHPGRRRHFALGGITEKREEPKGARLGYFLALSGLKTHVRLLSTSSRTVVLQGSVLSKATVVNLTSSHLETLFSATRRLYTLEGTPETFSCVHCCIAMSAEDGGGASPDYEMRSQHHNQDKAKDSARSQDGGRRYAFACRGCKRRKAKCDGAQPTCSRCGRLGETCSYSS
jgi:hypothetical protein